MKLTQYGASLAFGILSGLCVHTGCVGSSADQESTTQDVADKDPGFRCKAGTPVDSDRACDPSDTKKTTICHIPPGNPMNAHTLCVGTPAVDAHLAHGDYLGVCAPVAECTPTAPPPDSGPPTQPPPIDSTPGSGSGSGTGSGSGSGTGSGSGSGTDVGSGSGTPILL